MRTAMKAALVTGLWIVFGSATELAIAQTPSSTPAPGRLVDIGGHKLHIHCVGPSDGRPTVILEAGGGGFASGNWPPGASSRHRAAQEARGTPRSLSRNAKFVLDSLSGHNIQNDNPQIVARAIEEVLEAVLKGARVAL